MRRVMLALAALTVGMLALPAVTRPASAEPIRVEAVIWQLDKDYPGAEPNDVNLPFRTVYIKTHDGTDWMATYDGNPLAVAGPDSLRNLMNAYALEGIDVAAWFVPTGRDVETQVRMAEQVLDTGVKALYADVEAFAGFCRDDCDYLATNFWQRLRAERPNAVLGVIYDPRPSWWEPAAAAKWLSVADVAAPMCFWETYEGQQPWGDPGGCVLNAHEDLAQLAPGRALAYVPMLQGDTTPDRFKIAVDTAMAMGAEHVSVWRRGVVPGSVWDSIKGYANAPTPCWVLRADNCVVREASSSSVYLLQGGAKFPVPDASALSGAGINSGDVQVAPDGFLSLVPDVPRDGTLLAEGNQPSVYVVYGGGRFGIPSPEVFAKLGFDWGTIRRVPVGALAQVAQVPQAYTRFREMGSDGQWVIIGNARMGLDPAKLAALLAAGKGKELYVVPDGALKQIPEAAPPGPGDVSCDGKVDATDALYLLQQAAGMPNLGLCSAKAGDVNCDANIDAVDALAVLRHVAGLPLLLPRGCQPIG